MTRTKLIAGNWKMNLTRGEAIRLAEEIAGSPMPTIDVAIFPPTIWLTDVATVIASDSFWLGAQTCSHERGGAFTGEVSATMIAEVASSVLVGHSERRLLMGESNELVRAKLDAALAAGLQPILCVGETLSTRQNGEAEMHIASQLQSALAHRAASELQAITIAYEPVWAIGTGVAASPADAQAMCQFVRATLAQLPETRAEAVRILYGGSMNRSNAAELLSNPDIDGGLVGGASLKAEEFLAICRAAI